MRNSAFLSLSPRCVGALMRRRRRLYELKLNSTSWRMRSVAFVRRPALPALLVETRRPTLPALLVETRRVGACAV